MQTVDLAIVGAGVFGLQLARQALLAGMSVALFERETIGAGASGGPLGALMPHIPDRWNAKKQFQFDALQSLEAECADLESLTGLSTGYGRVGRMMPLRQERFVALAEQRASGAREHWQGRYKFDRASPDENWLDLQVATHGAVLDTLAARVHPPSYLASLTRFVSDHPKGRLHAGVAVSQEAAALGCAETGDGLLRFSQLAVTAGYQTFPWLQPLLGKTLGSGVKGQARVVRVSAPENAPILYDDGCYIVPHANGTIAVGSSSQKQWTSEQEPDPEAWGFWDKALALCPALRDAPIIAEWAGVRPRGMSADPMIGPVPEHKGLWVFTGGFKISIGIAHRASAALVEQISGNERTIALPPSFEATAHFATADAAG